MQLEKGPTLAYVPTCILAHVTCYNKVVSKSLLVFLSGVLLLGIGFYLYTTDRISFVSPIPKIFGVSNTDEIHNYWFPRDIGHDYSDLNLSARSAILVDYDTGEIIFAKNIHARAWVMPKTATWTGIEIEHVGIPAVQPDPHGKLVYDKKSVDAKLILRLLGWYVAEGNLNHANLQV